METGFTTFEGESNYSNDFSLIRSNDLRAFRGLLTNALDDRSVIRMMYEARVESLYIPLETKKRTRFGC